MNLGRKILSRARRTYEKRLALGSLAPSRPIVMFQSDDWGRVGIPSAEMIEKLRAEGATVGESAWDYYGLESERDVIELGDLLEGFRDRDGRRPTMTANFVMANADLPRMRDEHFQEFRWISLSSGFPAPWSGNLLAAYLENRDRGVFEPGLHGFTHFNTSEMLACLREDSDRGRRARLLVANDVPYLASYTPEYNFALASRRRDERLLGYRAQLDWIAQGIELFQQAFGEIPRTVCAPGYRANATTARIWRQFGIESMQSVGDQPLTTESGLLQLHRNVEFEPVLSENDVVPRALAQAARAVSRGTPVVVCTHSINYITRFVRRAEDSRELLRRLITSLLELYPDLRFASARDVFAAWREERSGWFSAPSPIHRSNRRRTVEHDAVGLHHT